MKNICDKCNVELDPKLNSCPLCGRNINNLLTTTHNSTSTYPNSKVSIPKKYAIIKLIFMMLICLTIASFAIEFFIVKKIIVSYYILIACVVVYFSILLPIKHNFSLSTSSIIALIFLLGYIIFIELYSNTFGWGLQYVIPCILLAYSIYNAILIVAKGYVNFEFFLPVLISAIISTVTLIIVYVNNWVIWPHLSASLLSWLVTILLVGIRYKKFKNNMKKKFHL